MKTGIYMIRNKINDKAYIGQAIDIYARWEQHIRELNNNLKYCNPHLQNAWNKYGADNFEFTIICQCLEQDLDRLEIHYIAHYHTFYKDGDGGYNLTFGGDGIRGYRWTDEQRAKLSETLKESMSRPEVKAKISEAKKEYYKDPENRKKISEAKKGKPRSEETKAKISERTREAMNRPEVRKKVSESMKEENKRRWSNPEYKAKMSEALNKPEVRAKISESLKKDVYCVTNDTVYVSVSEAGGKLGIDYSYISWCCKGKNITKRYPDGHHHKKGKSKDSPVYELWYLDEYEKKFGKVAM